MKKEEAFIEKIVERDDMLRNGSRSSHCCAKRVEE